MQGFNCTVHPLLGIQCPAVQIARPTATTTDTGNFWLTVRFALTHFSFHQCLKLKVNRTEAVFWKPSSYRFVFLRSRSPIDVCEHLVYKCLEYLIFVIKNGRKTIHLSRLNYCKGLFTWQHLRPKHHWGRLKGFIS